MVEKIFNKSLVRGISVTLPKSRVAVRDLLSYEKNPDDTIRITGIEEVRHADADKTPVDYCVHAAENLFSDLNFDKSQIDGIVFATPLEDYITVGNGYLMQARLGLSEKCVVIDLKQACAGFVHGLFQASMLIQTGYCKNVLLFAGGESSKSINAKDKSLMSVMSDGVVAAIISFSDNASESAFSFFNDGNRFNALYIPAGGVKIPVKHGVTDVETVDEHGNVRSLEDSYMDGLEVMIFVMDAAPDTVNEVLKTVGWKKDEVDKFFFHQANNTILKTIGKRLRIPQEKIPIHLKNYGNTAAVSIPLTISVDNALAGGGAKNCVR